MPEPFVTPSHHDPNPSPPSADPTFLLIGPDGGETGLDVSGLQRLPIATVTDCYIVSTGHGASGPFTFTGAHLADLLAAYLDPGQVWSQVEVISGDGFGTRVRREELETPGRTGQIVLAYVMDGAPMTRAQGLVRLIVPAETDDALRQVKWVSRIEVRA
jgi:DMSO/TMAO reductase YedYZ molybdopterin-dependent catalytic subunit